MQTVVEPLEGNKVKLSVQVDEQEFERAIDAAFRKIAREVRIPGFRPGKAPRRILEARLGKETGRAEALRDALPDYYAQALRENEVDAIAAPDIDITSGQQDGAVAFDAVVEVRPQLKLAGYGGLRVTVPNPEVTEEDISAQIDRLRSNFGRLEAVERPARDGDHLTLDLDGRRNGESVPGMTTEDFLYELGSGTVLPELDVQLQGARVGEIFAFDADLPDGPVSFKALVKDVKEKVLPEVTDEWAEEASEFDTVEELRADITKRAGLVKRIQATMALRSGAVEALVELVDTDPPPPLVDAEIERQAHELAHRLDAQKATLEQYLEATGQTQEQLVQELRNAAVPSVKADLALRAVAEAEGLAPSDDDVDSEIERLASQYEMKPAELRRNLQRTDQMPAVRSDLKKRKAVEWLLEHVEIVDAEGQAVDRALLELDGDESSSPESEPSPESESSPESEQAQVSEEAAPVSEDETVSEGSTVPEEGEPA